MSVYDAITVVGGLFEINPLKSYMMTDSNTALPEAVQAKEDALDDDEIYVINSVTHDLRAKICKICNTTFKRADHLKRHIQNLHSNQIYDRCPECEQNCESKEALIAHVEDNHPDSDVFPCRACGLECLGISVLIKHENGHNSTQILCPHCKAPFKRRDHMLRHARSQHFNMNVQCPVCKQYYKRKDHLVRHVREKHRMLYLNGELVKFKDVNQDLQMKFN